MKNSEKNEKTKKRKNEKVGKMKKKNRMKSRGHRENKKTRQSVKRPLSYSRRGLANESLDLEAFMFTVFYGTAQRHISTVQLT